MEAKYDYALVGGGVTAVWAAQNIRERDKDGKIVIIGAEPHPPYDRPPLSKNFLLNDSMAVDDPYSKFDDFYPKNDIELHTKTKATRIDRAAQTVTLDNGTTFGYGKLLLATGARARKLNVPGANRPGVLLLRELEDAIKVRAALQQNPRVVIVGAGYIGMETAAAAQMRGLDVTILEPQGRPWPNAGSESFGRFVQGYYKQQGVKFVFNDEAAAFEGEGENGPVTAVRTKKGAQLPADLVIIGVGAELNTALAQAAGLEMGERGGVKVNEFLQTSDPNIWAAGDIAHFKDIALDKEWHAEHFLNAKWQGQAVGKIMAGENAPYDRVAYFYSDVFDLHLCLRGNSQGGANSVFWGDVEGAEFAELYYDEAGRLTMGIVVSRDEPKMDSISDVIEPLIRAKAVIKGREAEIQSPGFDLSALGVVSDER